MTHMTAARLMGALILISTCSYMTASNLLTPILQLPDFLSHLVSHKRTISLAAMLEFVNSATVVSAAIVIYPIIKQYNERIALTYVATRIAEGILLLTGAVLIVSLVNISEILAAASADSAELLQLLTKVQLQERFYFFQMGMLPLALGGFILCVTFYQYRMIPRGLAVLGLIGYFVLLVKVIVNFFGIKAGGLFFIPGALFELAMPLWLLVKGFDTHRLNHL